MHSSRKVIVTGAFGYVGRHALEPLVARGFEVVALTSRDTVDPPAGVRPRKVDLLDRGEVARLLEAERPSHLLHLAWETTAGKFWNADSNLRWLAAGCDLLQAFADAGGQRVVGVGTCAEYDWSHGYCVERVTPLRPRGLYGVAKHAMATMLEEFAGLKKLSAAWGRVFFMIGPHEQPGKLVGSVIASLRQGAPIRCSHGRQIRDFLYVADVARGLVELLDSPVTGPVNICSGEPTTLRDVVSAIVRGAGSSSAIDFGAIPPQANEPPLLVGDARRLRDEVGWQPEYDLERGVAALLAAEKLGG